MAPTKGKDTGLVKEIQKVLLDDADFLRMLLQENLQQVLRAEFENFIQAQPYERSEHRQGYRNGSYMRRIKTRVGTLELEVMRDRDGKFTTELFRRYQRSEQALVLSMIEMYIHWVSTRKVKRVVEMLWHGCIQKYGKYVVKRVGCNYCGLAQS